MVRLVPSGSRMSGQLSGKELGPYSQVRSPYWEGVARWSCVYALLVGRTLKGLFPVSGGELERQGCWWGREGQSGGLVSSGRYTAHTSVSTALILHPGAIKLYVSKFSMKMCPIAVPSIWAFAPDKVAWTLQVFIRHVLKASTGGMW